MTSISCSRCMYPRDSRMKKRSIWASGSGKVPKDSMGFWVASTIKGSSSRVVTPSTVICRSSMASRRADWVRGVARFSSSASTKWLNSGPGRNSNSLVFWL